MRKFSSGVGVGLNFKRRGEVLLFTYLPPIPSLITKHILLFVLSEGGGLPEQISICVGVGKEFLLGVCGSLQTGPIDTFEVGLESKRFRPI